MNIRYSYDNQALIACGHNSYVKTFELDNVFLKDTYTRENISENFNGKVKMYFNTCYNQILFLESDDTLTYYNSEYETYKKLLNDTEEKYRINLITEVKKRDIVNFQPPNNLYFKILFYRPVPIFERIVASYNDKCLLLCTLSDGKIQKNRKEVFSTKITALDYNSVYNKILVGSELGEIKVLDLEELTDVNSYSFVHESSVTFIKQIYYSNAYISGGNDGKVLIKSETLPNYKHTTYITPENAPKQDQEINCVDIIYMSDKLKMSFAFLGCQNSIKVLKICMIIENNFTYIKSSYVYEIKNMDAGPIRSISLSHRIIQILNQDSKLLLAFHNDEGVINVLKLRIKVTGISKQINAIERKNIIQKLKQKDEVHKEHFNELKGLMMGDPSIFGSFFALEECNTLTSNVLGTTEKCVRIGFVSKTNSSVTSEFVLMVGCENGDLKLVDLDIDKK